MSSITTKDGVQIFYKDWGKGQLIVFSHGWPLSVDDWDAQMMFFLSHGYRVIAHDRRGHGRSTQTGGGHDMDHYADDLAALTAHLDLKDAVHVGHSTGGGEVVHYLARHGESRVAKAVIISAVPPLMVKSLHRASRHRRHPESGRAARTRPTRRHASGLGSFEGCRNGQHASTLMGGSSMGERIDDTALDTLFREARTYTKWQPRPVDDEALRALYELLKWAPTSANAAPARFAFLRSKEAKERLRPALAPLNVEKTMTAPVTVIIAYDMKFYEQLPKLFPHSPGMAALFASNPELVEATAKRNSSLQGAYLIMAARALGLDCGPMSGFDPAKVDEEFFAAGKPCFGCDQEFFPEGHVKTNFLCNLGYGDPSALHPRLPRLPFNEACSFL
jgi:3-hydroxypropanoate dehydrogenase